MIYNPIESISKDQLRTLQNRRLMALRDRLRTQATQAASQLSVLKGLRDIEDLPSLPFTRKEDLREGYPFGRLALPLKQVRRIHVSSGTTGQPTVVGYTEDDLGLFAEVNARSLAAAGVTPGMMLHNAYGYGLFTGGLGLHAGAERLGLTVVPVSGGATERQVRLILDLRPDVISCTPSYAQTLTRRFCSLGVPPADISLKFALLGAEPWTSLIRTEVEAGLELEATNIYGLSEIIGPGVAQECREGRDGSHVWEDHFLPEIVDPDTGEVLPDGKIGVLVLTTLTKQCMPLLRYWTGDMTSLDQAMCCCGRTHARISQIRGRSDDMLIIRGLNLYPSQVEELLADFPALEPHYQLIVTRPETSDRIELLVESSEPTQGLAVALRDRLKTRLGLRFEVTLQPLGSLPESEGGKLTRVDDRR